LSAIVEVPVLVSHLRKLREEIEELEKAIKQLRGTIKPPEGEVIVKPVVIEKVLNNRRAVFRLDLSTARDNEPLGIPDKTGGLPVNFLLVQRLDNPIQIRVNSKSADLEDVSVGFTIEDFEINEVYVTNSATSGYAVIVVEWRVD